MHPELQHTVTAKCPPHDMELLSEDARLIPTALEEPKLLAPLVSKIEPDGKGIPVLLRQYLRLGGTMAAFNIDHDFGDTLDCLVIVEPRATDARVRQRYLGISD